MRGIQERDGMGWILYEKEKRQGKERERGLCGRDKR
jgi:hypothetical protein